MNARIQTFTLTLLCTLACMASSQAAYAEVSEDQFQMMMDNFRAMSQRLDALEQANTQLKADNAELSAANARLQESSQKTAATVEEMAGAAKSSSWADRINIKGDFRQRWENIDQEGKDSRNRTRVRARAAITAKVTDDVTVGLGLASGGDDPVSTNQTLGEGGTTKDMRLDLAYFQWTGLENTTLVGGKFKNLMYKPGKHALLWDGDWNPEGFGLSWADGPLFVNVQTTWLESDSKKEEELGYMLQGGFKTELGDGAKLTAGVGYHNFDTKGMSAIYDDSFFGNSFNPVTGTYLYNYEVLELFADISFKLGDMPANAFVDYVQNQDAGNYDTGWAAGFKVGSASAPGTFDFAWIYQDLEADATLALISDSDFGGGGTDGKGHIFKGGYAIAKNWKASFTYFMNEIDGNLGSEKDYDRLQVDLAFKY